MKKYHGQLLAVLVTLLVILIGYIGGRYYADYYNKKHNTNKTFLQILKIEKLDEKVNYFLESGSKTLNDLCKKETGICDKTIGKVKLNNKDYDFYIYADLDNNESYFKLDNTKVGDFYNLEKIDLFNNYLLVTENNNNYQIHIIDENGKRLESLDALNNYEIKDQSLYFYNCENNRESYYKVKSSDLNTKEEVSYKQKACG